MAKPTYILIWLLCFLSLTASMQSCRVYPETDFTGYKNELGHRNMYVVDTIQIAHPVQVVALRGNLFVMPKEVLDRYDGTMEFFFNNDSIFLLQPFFPFGTPELLQYSTEGGEDCYKHTAGWKDINDKYIESVSEYIYPPRYFLLVLVNRIFFDVAFRGVDGPMGFRIPYSTFPYYRVAIPECFKEDAQ